MEGEDWKMNTVKNGFVEAIDAQVAARSLLTHPFYQAWTRGELTLEALRDYATQYYHHVAAFPTYLSSVHSHTEDQAARRLILENLMDEEAGHPNHPELWLRFAETLGADRDAVQKAEQRDETKNLIGTFRSICRDRSTTEGLAALYAYESQIPAVSETKIDGLKKFYNITTPNGLGYFDVHIVADKEHSRVERNLLGASINEQNAPAVTKSVDDTLDALWEMLSGMCHKNGITCEANN